jgi:hypothetical protein
VFLLIFIKSQRNSGKFSKPSAVLLLSLLFPSIPLLAKLKLVRQSLKKIHFVNYYNECCCFRELDVKIKNKFSILVERALAGELGNSYQSFPQTGHQFRGFLKNWATATSVSPKLGTIYQVSRKLGNSYHGFQII